MRCLKSRLDPSRFFEPSLELSRPAKNLSRHNTSGQQEKQSQPIESQINGKICLKSASLDECIRLVGYVLFGLTAHHHYKEMYQL